MSCQSVTSERDNGIPLENEYVKICNIADIPNGGRKCVQLGADNILIFNINHTFYAVKNRCTHLDFPLDDGRQIGTDIICRQHGARFDICSGKALGGPAVFNVKTYPVRIVGKEVQVQV